MPYATFGTWIDPNYYESLYRQGIPVVIDAASFGTSLNGQFGKGFTGTVVFSFHATKVFGIGEGGLVYSSNSDLIQEIRKAKTLKLTNSSINSLVMLIIGRPIQTKRSICSRCLIIVPTADGENSLRMVSCPL